MKIIGALSYFALTLALVVLARTVSAQESPKEEKEDYVKAHYTKYEYRIPMRDKKKLFTSVYIPKDTSQPYPMLMDRTPYNVGPYGEDQYKKQVFRKKELPSGIDVLTLIPDAPSVAAIDVKYR